MDDERRMSKDRSGEGGSTVRGRMREWAAPSYCPKTGRAASAYGKGEATSFDGLRCNPSAQINQARAGGSGDGNPGVSAMNKSGSADKGRRVWGGSDVG